MTWPGRDSSKPAPSSFDERLRAAERQAGLVPAAERRAPALSGLAPGLRVGIELVSALAVATGIGWLLDSWLHTMPLFLVVFVLLGGVAGVLNAWRVARGAPPA